ncbi:MAG: hypothetical protein R3272_10085 [Candidatus Promineifilaceae bacterium]|nr:hypothetical protein [Candidatus Promineifilaceae bacterium]
MDGSYARSPNRRIRMPDKHLETEAFEAPRGQRMAMDDFFRCRASVQREAIALVVPAGHWRQPGATKMGDASNPVRIVVAVE